jgi:hypothetical protein
MVCVLAAQQVGVGLGELDQLLWWPAPESSAERSDPAAS